MSRFIKCPFESQDVNVDIEYGTEAPIMLLLTSLAVHIFCRLLSCSLLGLVQQSMTGMAILFLL